MRYDSEWHRHTYRRAYSLARRAIRRASRWPNYGDLGLGYCLTTAIERETIIGPGSSKYTQVMAVSVHPSPGVLALVRRGVVLDVAVSRADAPRLVGAAVLRLVESYRTMPHGPRAAFADRLYDDGYGD